MGIFDIFESWNNVKVLSFLQISKKRAENLRNRSLKQQRAIELELVKQLKLGKEEKARLKAEQILRERSNELAMDLLETYIEAVATRVKYLGECREVPAEMKQPIASIIYAEKRFFLKKNTNFELFRKKFNKTARFFALSRYFVN